MGLEILNEGFLNKYVKPRVKVNEAVDEKFKLRFYKIGGNSEGELDHEEFFTYKNDAINKYKEVFKRELFSLNPTLWEKQGNDWKKISPYTNESLNDKYRINYDDDLVIVKKGSKVIYKGLEDYEPMKNEPWKFDGKKYTLNGGYTKKLVKEEYESDDEIIQNIIDNFNKITGRSLKSIYTFGNDDSPMFDQNVVDETADKIIDYLSDNGYGQSRIDDLLYKLDDKLALYKSKYESLNEDTITDKVILKRALNKAGYNVKSKSADKFIENAVKIWNVLKTDKSDADYNPNMSISEFMLWIKTNYPDELKVLSESLNEDTNISDYQKWVDYDMKKYKRISNNTMSKIKKAGFSVVKDQYGDYEVIADRKDECYKDESLKEDLDKSDYNDFVDDLMNKIANTVARHGNGYKKLSKKQIKSALQWCKDNIFDEFDNYWFDESLKTKLNGLLRQLHEKEMSDEDKADNEVLKGIYLKLQDRRNARLTPDEQKVLDKYGLSKDPDYKNVVDDKGNLLFNRETTSKQWGSKDKRSPDRKVNYVDRASKMKTRGRGYEHEIAAWDPDVADANVGNEWKDPETGKYKRIKKGLLDRERNYQNVTMHEPYRQMKYALDDKKKFQASLANANKELDKKLADLKAKYDSEVERVKKQSNWKNEYDSNKLKRSQQTINKLLKKDEVED